MLFVDDDPLIVESLALALQDDFAVLTAHSRSQALHLLRRMEAVPSLALVDLGPFNVIVALTIAVAKATLVVLYFMHLRYSTRLTWAVVASSVFWLGILLALTFSDYLTRGWRTFG